MAAIPPGAWLGLLGGGQLGRMFCMAAQSLGYRVVVLDPGREGPAASVADRHIAADYLDARALDELAALAAAATTEFENVPAASLDFLAHTARVTPSAASVAIAQDRISEKMFLSGNGFAVAPFAVLRSEQDVAGIDGARLLPGIVKSARFGYDGKGQAAVATVDEVRTAWRYMSAQGRSQARIGLEARSAESSPVSAQACVLERRIALACEVSVIVARNERGDTCTWPVAENRHRDGILDVSIVPAPVDGALAALARDIAHGVAGALDYRGVLCVEIFVSREGHLLVNEIAPRPHNSGHFTIDACVTSQFEQQARVLADLPLGDTRQHTPAVMVNVLGDVWFEGETLRDPPWAEVLKHPSAKLHLYGKSEPRRGRKMGHVTCLGDTLTAALATAREIKRALGIPGAEEL